MKVPKPPTSPSPNHAKLAILAEISPQVDLSKYVPQGSPIIFSQKALTIPLKKVNSRTNIQKKKVVMFKGTRYLHLKYSEKICGSTDGASQCIIPISKTTRRLTRPGIIATILAAGMTSMSARSLNLSFLKIPVVEKMLMWKTALERNLIMMAKPVSPSAFSHKQNIAMRPDKVERQDPTMSMMYTHGHQMRR